MNAAAFGWGNKWHKASPLVAAPAAIVANKK